MDRVGRCSIELRSAVVSLTPKLSKSCSTIIFSMLKSWSSVFSFAAPPVTPDVCVFTIAASTRSRCSVCTICPFTIRPAWMLSVNSDSGSTPAALQSSAGKVMAPPASALTIIDIRCSPKTWTAFRF